MKNINIPETWPLPKHHFGKQVQQGEIIGMEYHHPSTELAEELGGGWFYTVKPNKFKSEVETIEEADITLLTIQELQAEIESLNGLIRLYQNSIAGLRQQLSQLNQCNN